MMSLKKTPPILAIGSLGFDTVQTPTRKADQVLGGSANFFSIAASFYAPVQIIAVVGSDFPKAHLDLLESRHIDVSGIQIQPGKTFHWAGSYQESFQEAQTLSTELNVFEKFQPVLQAAHQKTPYVFLANIDPTLQRDVLKQAQSPHLIALDSMNFWIQGKLKELKETLKKIDILLLNETEAFLLSGEKNPIRAAPLIQNMGPSVLIIKRGAYGALLFSNQDLFIAPAFPIQEIVDPTGAGDSFAGAFMGYLAQAQIQRTLLRTDPAQWNLHLRRAVLAGCVMASFTVEDFSFNRLLNLKSEALLERQEALFRMSTLPSVS